MKLLRSPTKYAYLDEKKIYSVIITANLSEHEEERLLKVLRKHRATIGYTLDDLKGISPTLCQHKICSHPTSDGQVSVLKCHPWIGMLTHTVLEDL